MKQARILLPTSDGIQIAAQAIAQGDVVGMPTETVYGLAGDAFNESALQKIFKTKERPTFDPLIVHVPPSMKTLAALSEAGIVDLSQIQKHDVAVINSVLAAFWPGPLTVVLPKQNKIPDLATSGLPSVAVRMPRHEVAQKLLLACGRPLAAPSANRFGRISPTTAGHVQAELGDRIDYILDGGPCTVGVESTVIALLAPGMPLRFVLLRPGGVSAADIEAVTGPLARVLAPGKKTASATHDDQPQVSPGMLASHYAPRKGLTLLPCSLSNLSNSDVATLLASLSSHSPEPLGLLLMEGSATQGAQNFSRMMGREVICKSLSQSGDIDEAARELFAQLRALDDSAAAVLFAEPCTSDHGMGHAIADRLKRASLK